MQKKILNIAGRLVGDKYPPLIIPEIGINHNGSLERAFRIVDAAKKVGAEIIKHQTHIPDDEMSIEAKKIKPGNSKRYIYDIISSCSLSEEEEFKLLNYTKRKKIIFLSTPFGRKAIDRLNKFGVDTFKIGSGEVTNIPLIEYACKLKKNLIISTGMVDLNYVIKLKKILDKKKVNYAFLHTTSLYPVPDNLVRLGALDQMRKTFKNTIIGYSDHTEGNIACYAALAKGASIIEKHFVDTYKTKGPDIVCSCDKRDLGNLIKNSKRIFTQIQGIKNLLKEEKITRDFAFASVVTIKNIKKGEVFSAKNLWVKRPATGNFRASELTKLFGKKSTRNLIINNQLRKKDVI